MTFLGALRNDLRFTARSLGKSRGFAAVLVPSIGANSAIFGVIEGEMLRSLPYPEAERIVRVFHTGRSFPTFPVNHFDLRDFRENTTRWPTARRLRSRGRSLSKGIQTAVVPTLWWALDGCGRSRAGAREFAL